MNVIGEVKAHIERHKRFYVVCSYVLLAGITYTIVRGTVGRGSTGVGIGRGSISNTASFSFARQSINLVTVLDREGRGHPGWPVRNLETKRIFFSQREAAEAFGITRQALSAHVNGKFPDVDGLHFERVNLAPLE